MAHIHISFSCTECNVTTVPLLALEDVISFSCMMKANLGEYYNSYCSSRVFIYINAPTEYWQALDHEFISQFISFSQFISISNSNHEYSMIMLSATLSLLQLITLSYSRIIIAPQNHILSNCNIHGYITEIEFSATKSRSRDI